MASYTLDLYPGDSNSRPRPLGMNPVDPFQIESSGYDRTIESATAVAFGLYPSGQLDADLATQTLLIDNQIVTPVHSSQPENDRESLFVSLLVSARQCPRRSR